MCLKNMTIWKKKSKILIINVFDVIKEMLISKKELTKTNYKRLQEAMVYIKNNLIDTDLTEINNIITGWSNVTFS